MTKLQLTNINKNNQPVSDGESERKIITGSRLDLKKILDYCNPDHCLSCAYFQQTKGNFGRCTILKNDKKFDGSKKGSSCSAWRLDKALVDAELQKRINDRKKKEKTWIDKIREDYNIQAKQTQFENSRKGSIFQKDEMNLPFKIEKTKTRDDALPFARTSDVTRFRAYYKHKFNRRIIDYAIQLMNENKTLSSRQISKEIQIKFNRKVTHQTILSWGKDFIPERKFNLKNGAHRPEVNHSISKGVSTYFKVKNMYIISDEIKEKILQLFFSDLSLRQIAKTIEKENSQKLTISKIYTTLQKEIKDELISVKDPSMFNRSKLVKNWVYNK